MPQTYKEALREEIKKRIEYTITSGENFDFATNLILELFDQHLERLVEKVEGMEIYHVSGMIDPYISKTELLALIKEK